MKFLHDKQMKIYCCFLTGMIMLSFLLGGVFLLVQTKTVQNAFLERENEIATSLLEQGISEHVIATALSSTQGGSTGSDFLVSIGRTNQASSRFFPFAVIFRQTTGNFLLAAGLCFALLLLSGTYVFLRSREHLYQQAQDMIADFIDGDYSRRMPQAGEGSIYQLYASIDKLATNLQAQNEMEHRAKEFLKNTISDISHQLKTPLAALTMYQEIIEGEPDNADVVKEFSAKMGLSLKRMEQLIMSMLKITRLDVGMVTFEKEPCQISELVLKSVSELTTRAEGEKKKILLDGSVDDMLVCDMEWTSEAIGNIVKNALDHTKAGGNIRIHWEYSSYIARIMVGDDGKGIASEDIYHIFKRFYRSSSSSDTQGVGLGLPLAKSIIEGQGGTISVYSNPGEGTVFTISFLTEL